MKTENISSIGIRKQFGAGAELEILGSIGEGDGKLTLYRGPGGLEVIETNGDPVWDCAPGFQAAREQIMGV